MDDSSSGSISMSDSSYQNLPRQPSISSDDDVDSLPSTSASTTEDGDYSDAEREWRESLQQLELILTMVLVPYIGKYFGRKAAYWGWTRFMEWQYPVRIEITSRRTFRAAGMLEAAATL